jgi:predicted permease
MRLIRQLLTESMVVAVCGGVVGLILATWAVGAQRASGTTLVPRLLEVRVDAVVALFSLGLSLVTGVLFGLVPALRLASNRLHDSIKEGARGAAGGAVARFRSALMLGEVAVAVVLLVGAGLLIRSFDRLTRVNPGFSPEGVLTYQVTFPASRYGDAATTLPPVYDQILERTRGIPGVRAVAVSNTLPMQGSGYISFQIENIPFPQRDAAAAPIDVQPFTVSPEYLAVMGLKLQRGRFIETRDVAGAGDVLVINNEMARLYFPEGRDPIGIRVSFDGGTQWFTIIGIVDVVAQEGLDAKPYAQVYLPIAQAQRRVVFVSMRTDGDPRTLIPAARAALRGVDTELPMNDVRTMAARVEASIAAPRVSLALLTGFAALAMLLAAIGIYGVLAYSVAQRTREIGIRMALGASAASVRRLIVMQGMTPAVGGLAIGLVGAYFGTRIMEKLLFGVEPTDPVTFAAVSVFLAGIALLASYIPSRRATRVAPTEALRYD